MVDKDKQLSTWISPEIRKELNYNMIYNDVKESFENFSKFMESLLHLILPPLKK